CGDVGGMCLAYTPTQRPHWPSPRQRAQHSPPGALRSARYAPPEGSAWQEQSAFTEQDLHPPRMTGRYFHEVTQLMFKWLNRRSQRKSYTWAQFGALWSGSWQVPRPRVM